MAQQLDPSLLFVWVKAFASVEVVKLEEKRNSCDGGPHNVLQNLFLGMNENNIHKYGKEVGVKFQKAKLDFVVDDLCPIMEIYVEFVFDEVESQSYEDEKQDHGDVKAEEGDQRPKFEKDYRFELEGETGILHVFVQDLLASVRSVFILDFFLALVPAAVEEVNVS